MFYYLDIDDIINLFKLYPKQKIRQVWKEKILVQEPMYHGINRLYAFLFFDIKNPDRYIRILKIVILNQESPLDLSHS